MPKPKAGESEKDFIARCIPEVMQEGATQEQALGKCYGIYRAEKEDIKDKIGKSIAMINELLSKTKKEHLLNLYEDEKDMIKKNIENLNKKEFDFLFNIYCKSRQDGNSIEKSLEIAEKMSKRNYRKINRMYLLESIKDVLESIKNKKGN